MDWSRIGRWWLRGAGVLRELRDRQVRRRALPAPAPSEPISGTVVTPTLSVPPHANDMFVEPAPRPASSAPVVPIGTARQPPLRTGAPVRTFDPSSEVKALALKDLTRLSDTYAWEAYQTRVETLWESVAPGSPLDLQNRALSFRAVLNCLDHPDSAELLRLLHPRSAFDAFEGKSGRVLVEKVGEWPKGVAAPQPERAMVLLRKELSIPESPLPDEVLQALAETLPITVFELLAKAGWRLGGPRQGPDAELQNLFGPLGRLLMELIDPIGANLNGANEYLRQIRLNQPVPLGVAVELLTDSIAFAMMSTLGNVWNDPAWQSEHKACLASDVGAAQAAQELRNLLRTNDPRVGRLAMEVAHSLNSELPEGTRFPSWIAMTDPRAHLAQVSTALFHPIPRFRDHPWVRAFATSSLLSNENPGTHTFATRLWSQRLGDGLLDPKLGLQQKSAEDVLLLNLEEILAKPASLGARQWLWTAALGCVRRDPEMVREAFQLAEERGIGTHLTDEGQRRTARAVFNELRDSTIAFVQGRAEGRGSVN